ncbi:archaeosortase A [Natronomonas sp. EA1]|uniref:archaeosortase A n=1 Tax=Natronomonas sp. EA1 TaxID=3421655 RepID=UPI003EC0991D
MPLETYTAVYDAIAVPFAWFVVALFAVGALAQYRDEPRARWLLAGAWAVFGLFWAFQAPHFAFVQKSAIEGVGAVVAAPASLHVARLLLGGRDSLVVLSRAVAVMGVVFMPFEAVPWLQEWLVEVVAGQTRFLMTLLGFEPTLIPWDEAARRVAAFYEFGPERTATYAGKYAPYENTFFFTYDGRPITYTIVLACTGLGSMAIFAGLIAGVRAPLSRKVRAFAVSIPVIYALNLVRNVFIGLSFGHQYAHVFPDLVMAAFGTDDPYMVSYFVADRVIAQSLSVVALVAVTYLVVRELPEVLTPVEDLLYVATGNEYDLGATLEPGEESEKTEEGEESEEPRPAPVSD